MTRITITFDNGPDPDVTPVVLDTLASHDLKSTFFVLGDKLRDRRNLVERAHAEGHWIGNHTFNHLVPLGLSAEPGIAAREIAQTELLIGELAHPRRFFRPFGGHGMLDQRLLNHEALIDLENGGYTCVLWNAIPEDWAYPTSWVERALDICFAMEHSVLVLHDLPTGAMDYLGKFLSLAKDRGATFEQDFPTSCLLLEQGRRTRAVEPFLTVPAH